MTLPDTPAEVGAACMARPPDNVRLLQVIGFQSEIVAADVDPQTTMQLSVDRAAELTAADGAVIELADADEMVYSVAAGTLVGFLGTRLALGASLSGLAVRTGETMMCTDSETDDRVDIDACRRIGLRSMVCVPLVHDRRNVGVLKVIAPDPDHFDGTDVAVLRMLCSVISVAMFKAALIERLHNEASTDALTGLANRRTWDRAIDGAVARGRRTGHPLSVLVIDLNGFKEINDTLGHEAGDEVLRNVAYQVSAMLRTGELFARTGGDEFAILAEDTPAAGAARLAARLADALVGIAVVAVGHATLRRGESADDLVRRADQAMYVDKAGAKTGLLTSA